jgi:hypothetical protein
MECNCRSFLEVTSLTVTGTVFTITVANQPLNDGRVYNVRLNQTFPALTGAETVAIVDNGVSIQLVDRRARAVLAERVSRYGERLRMVYTQQGAGGVPVFMVLEGIAPIPPQF